MKLSALLALAVLLCGCATKTGRWYPIIGIGWVTVNTNQTVVVSSRALGLNTGPGQMNLGVSSFSTATVPTNANVIIELHK